jgi:hypothetical protein
MQPAKAEPGCGAGIAGHCLLFSAAPQIRPQAPGGSANMKAMIRMRAVTTSGECANRGGINERVPHLRNLLFDNRNAYRLVAAIVLLTNMRRGGCEKNPGGGGSNSTIGCVQTAVRDSTGRCPMLPHRLAIPALRLWQFPKSKLQKRMLSGVLDFLGFARRQASRPVITGPTFSWIYNSLS